MSQVKKRGLGRGMNALIRVDEEAEAARLAAEEKAKLEGLQQIPISEIEADARQPRKSFDEEAMAELTESVKKHGVLQPLILEKTEGGYRIVAGERRFRAAKEAGLETVPALLKQLAKSEALEVALIENLQREDLNPVEEAKAYERLSKEYSMKQDEIAQSVGKSRSAVANSLRLLTLDDEVLSYLASGELTMGHAKALLGVSSKTKRAELAKKVIAGGLNVRQTEKLAKEMEHPTKKQKEEPLTRAEQLAYKQATDRLKELMGTKVSIVRGKKDKGKIEIEYYSQDELERLLELFEKVK